MRRVQLAAIGVQLEHDGGGREGHQRAIEDRLVAGHARGHGERCHRRDGAHHLHQASLEHGAPETDDAGERQLEPDREEQQHHADLGQAGHRFRRADQPQAVRPDRDAREQEPDDRGDAKPLRQDDHGDRDGDQDDEVAEEGDFVHGQKHTPLLCLTALAYIGQ